MEVSALKYSGGIGLHGRSALLRLQSDERLVALVRRGNQAAFELLVSRYESRLLAFCRHMLGSREDAEDVLQDVLTAAYNAMLADDRAINVRPWLYRIARNRSLNHMRKAQAIGVDSMDVHLSEHGATTADKVHEREAFRLLVGDIRNLPETQRAALVLREMDALSYEQIAEAMETTVPSVKSLLVRARVSLAEAAEARLLSCEEVRFELAEVAEGLQRKPGPLVRRHLRGCARCETFQVQLKTTNKALAVLLPIGPLAVVKKLALLHLGHSAGSTAAGHGAAAGSGAAGAAGVAGASAAAGGGLAFGTGTGGLISAGMGAIATKAAAGLAAAALVTAGAVEVDHAARPRPIPVPTAGVAVAAGVSQGVGQAAAATPALAAPVERAAPKPKPAKVVRHPVRKDKPVKVVALAATTTPARTATTPATAPAPGRTDTTTVPTVLPPSDAGTPAAGSTTAATTGTPTTTTTTTPTSTGTTTTGTTPTGTTTTGTTTTGTTTTGTTTTGTTPTGTTPSGSSTTPSDGSTTTPSQ
jgi:RNA polymerase sigma factor (sigma-70 family)